MRLPEFSIRRNGYDAFNLVCLDVTGGFLLLVLVQEIFCSNKQPWRHLILGYKRSQLRPGFLGAIACYVFDLVLFTQTLQQLPVSLAVPVVSGIRIAATAILAYAFFGEHLTGSQWFASAVITVGIVIMSRT
ncbi:MAG: EamA family transporter [Cyanobacteria bacterium RM1_2_2]|nr:EamA family transporter [Cyanobacteria bacterium RM1_2_2]